MSLRVDDDKSSRRSRSRNDIKDERSVSPPKVKAAKSKKKARFGDDEDDGFEKAIPGAWGDEPEHDLKYEARQPRGGSARESVSQHSSRRTDAEMSGSEDEWDRGKSKRSSRPYDDETPTSSGGTAIQMPSFPGLAGFPSLPGFGGKVYDSKPPSTGHRQASVYPGMKYPSDKTGSFASMPSADYDALTYGQSYEPRSRRRRSPSASPELRPQPRHADSWSTREEPHMPPPPPRSNSLPYQAEVREVRPKGFSALSTLDEKDDGSKERNHRTSVSEPRTELRVPSIGSLQPRMNTLSVSGHSLHSGSGLPPPSPLLEAYKGTYQSISPMPSPSFLAHDWHHSVDEFESLTPLDESNKRLSFRPGKDADPSTTSNPKPKRRVVIYDAPTDAAEIWKALDHLRHIDTEPLIRILPGLTHDQLLELRETYRKTYKKGGEKVDMAKHIKLQTEGSFGKIAFVTASGRWKSEAYWASVWYQSHAAGRELLIESLMGRSNAEVREIKKAFRDRRYEDDLSRCMRKELKPDKFRDAVLAVLDEQRQEETDALPAEVKAADAETLRRAVTSPSGGESAILAIVVERSDKHLAEVLRNYQAAYRSRFAEDALKKSGNLVGEVIAHILNGVINRPARDSQLLHHAVEDISAKNKAVELRYELLMSRLVRLHWDRMHLAKVKQYYKEKYKVTVEEDIEDATTAGGDFGKFCLGLCES